MSTSKVKKQKSSKRDGNVECDATDVLVLPPKLLQKLGISLGNISLLKDDSTANNFINCDGGKILQESEFNTVLSTEIQSIQKNNLSSDTSIMETANLMKESVLLSPTFTAPTTINQDTTSHTLLNKDTPDLIDTIICDNDELNFASDFELIDTQNKYRGDIVMVEGINLQNKSDMELSLLNSDKCVDNTVEATTSYCTHKSNNKVSVISEEIITPKTLEEWKILETPDKSSLIPVSVNSLITMDKKNNKIHITNQQSIENQSIVTYLTSSPRINNEDVEKPNTILTTNIINGAVEVAEVVDCKNNAIKIDVSKVGNKIDCSHKINCFDSTSTFHKESAQKTAYDSGKNTLSDSDHNSIGEIGENGTDIDEELESPKCTEIDANNDLGSVEYPKKLLNLKQHNKQNSKEIPETQSGLGFKTHLGSFVETLNDKENISEDTNHGVKCKSLIQGVEKPGGEILTSSDESLNMTGTHVKTYSRKTLVKPQIISEPFDKANKKSFSANLNLKYENSFNTRKSQCFCICGDFGRYCYYEPEDGYEHLHFSKHTKVECSLDVLFSIYDDMGTKFSNDVSTVIYFDIDDADISDGSKNNDDDICFNNLHDYVEVNLDIPEKETLKTDISDINDTNIDSEYDDKNFNNEPKVSSLSQQNAMVRTEKIAAISSEICNEASLNTKDKLQTDIEITPNSLYDMDIIQSSTPNEKLKRTKRKRIDSEESPLIQSKKKRRNKIPEDSSSSPIVGKVSNDPVICGVCHDNVAHDLWFEHVSKQHSYLAWKESETPLDLKNEEVVHNHLSKILLEFGPLVCGRCGKQWHRTKIFLNHVNACSAVPSVTYTVTQNNGVVKCAVCKKDVTDWLGHISREHNYLAWKEGDSPIDFDNDEIRRNYLQNVTKEIGGLVCGKCGCRRKYVKAYLEHINTCDYKPELELEADSRKCGVCGESVSDWFVHIGEKHNYLAWVEGDTALEVNDEQSVQDHLRDIIKQCGELICGKCGLERKSVKGYLKHVSKCVGDPDATLDTTTSIIKCGLCKTELGNRQSWINHIEQEHNYLAWEEGQPALDITDKNAIYDHLYSISKENDGLVCSKCGFRRKYVKSYLGHKKTCHEGNSADSSLTISNNKKDQTSKCGLCQKEMENEQWLLHIGEEHDYIAWKDGEEPLDLTDKEAIYEHLYNISKQNDGLVCSKCGCRRKYVKSFLSHTKRCTGDPDCTNDSLASDLDSSKNCDKLSVKCGVCHQGVYNRLWIKHIAAEHNYLAWKENETPIDFSNEEAIYQHLYDTIQKCGEFICKRCGCRRKYAKLFMAHLKGCGDDLLDPSKRIDDNAIVACGVCKQELKHKDWATHIHRRHNYVAWKEGETPVDVEDKGKVFDHLVDLAKKYDGLTCAKCNVTKKYVKSFLEHIESCDSKVDGLALSDVEVEVDKDSYKCALCNETGPINSWRTHAFDKHYNVAWMVGSRPIDLKNSTAVEPYLKEYKRVKKTYQCLVCGLVRTSAAGFYAHIVVCGKSEEESDMFKNQCEICKSKYIGVYKSQHMKYHREQELSQQRKQMRLEAGKTVAGADAADQEESTVKRRAAEKANHVIKTFTVKIEEKSDGEDGGDNYVDDQNYDETKDSSSESEDSLTEISSEDISEATDVDSNEGNEKQSRRRRKKPTESSYALTNNRRFPTVVEDRAAYISSAAKDFREMHYTLDTLFPQWLTCTYEVVTCNEVSNYLPPLMESCTVSYLMEGLRTYKRFEARHVGKEFIMFAGGSINAMRWAPARADGGQWLCVHAHLAPDAPRPPPHHAPHHASHALLQLWDFTDMTREPELKFGLAHDFGAVWSIDWCPSGACEQIPEDATGFVRMGLLAVACSNGSAYIFSVPHPPTVLKNENFIYKLKPVAELRMYRDESRKVQCTAVSWSPQKGHTCIVTGYANGATAYYDLNTDSPLLTTVEDGVNIFYPFHDEKPHTACVNDVAALAGGSADGRALGAVCSASATGAAAWLGPRPAARATAHLPLAVTHVARAPLWPAAVLAGNSEIVTQVVNEVEWWGAGRRLGALGAAGGCAGCALVAAFVPPLLKTMQLHPVFADRRDIQIKAKIDLVPLDKKSLKKSTSQLLEMNSFEYENVIKIYGIEFKRPSPTEKEQLQSQPNKLVQNYAPLFPLANVTAMEFCPAPKYHKRLAIATHCGMFFVINT